MLGRTCCDLEVGILVSAKLHGWHLPGEEAVGRRLREPCSKTQERKQVSGEGKSYSSIQRPTCDQ